MTPVPARRRLPRPTGSQVRRLAIVVLLTAGLGGAVAGSRVASEIERSAANDGTGVFPLHEAESLGRPLEERITWLDSVAPLDRVPTEVTLGTVAADWADAWHTLDTLSSGGTVSDPKRTLDGAVLARVAGASPPPGALSVRQTAHQLRVEFFSIDGTTIGLSVPYAAAETVIDRGPGTRSLMLRTVTTYRAVMELVDGRWHLTVLDTSQPGTDTVRVERVDPGWS
ncbi:MAG: hypothetical protein ACK5RL_05275 [Acidimicrobiales bacterium]